MGQRIFFSEGLRVFRPWGGKKFIPGKEERGPIGEVWALSTHSEGESTICGKKLSEFYPEDMLEKSGSSRSLNYLVKWLDTQSELSVQVHPDDQFSQRVEGQLGKNECWIITEAMPGAHLYLGLRPGVTKRDLRLACERNLGVPDLLNKFEVFPGDFFYVPAGTVHALGPGLTLLEVQQSSGVTYRVWDWGRVDSQGRGRELHLEKAFQVICEEEAKNTSAHFNFQSLKNLPMTTQVNLVDNHNFKLRFFNLRPGENFQLRLKGQAVDSIFTLKGEVEVRDRSLPKDVRLRIPQYQQVACFGLAELEFHALGQDENWVAIVEA